MSCKYNYNKFIKYIETKEKNASNLNNILNESNKRIDFLHKNKQPKEKNETITNCQDDSYTYDTLITYINSENTIWKIQLINCAANSALQIIELEELKSKDCEVQMADIDIKIDNINKIINELTFLTDEQKTKINEIINKLNPNKLPQNGGKSKRRTKTRGYRKTRRPRVKRHFTPLHF